MESRAKAFGHPIHPMLIVFPSGIFPTSLGFDVAYLITGNGRWADVSYSIMAVGITGGLIAAIFGLIDFPAIPAGTRAWRVGLYHGVGNLAVVALFIMSWISRQQNPLAPDGLAISLSLAGVLLALVTGWLGGELVNRLGAGVDDDAHLDASPGSDAVFLRST